MTTYYTSSSHSNADDATFRSWITALHNAIVGCGLVQTADTGQLDFATATKPTVANTLAGYRVYRFDDSLQATAPIFIKLEVGTGANVTTTYGWRITVGNATTGAGVISGPIQTNSGLAAFNTATYTGTNDTFACHTAGAAWVAFYVEQGTANGSMCAFAVLRTFDGGVPTAEGASVYFRNGATASVSVVSLRFAATPGVLYTYNAGALPAFAPFSLTDSHVGTDIQIFPHWTATPRVRQSPYAFAYVSSELTHGVAITAEPYDGQPHTYMPLQGNAFGLAAAGTTNGVFGTALIWE